jgi:hypothetical protein
VPSTDPTVITTADMGKMRKRGEKIEKPSLLDLECVLFFRDLI